MNLRLLFLTLLLLGSYLGVVGQPGGNNTCATADPFCGSAAYTYLSGSCTSNCYGEPGPCYSCMSAPQNPAWYYLQVSTPGTIILSITELPYTDIDFCCWGPFTSPTGACPNGLTCSKVVSCSFSPSGNETCTIPNALPGEFYILVLSNFMNMTTQVTFLQSNWGQPGAGATNCNLVSLCSLSAITATSSSCSVATNTFSISGNIEFSNAPATGTLTVTDITAVPPVSQIFSAPFVSPKSYNLTGIPCDGIVHSVQAVFSDSLNCTGSNTIQAPQPQCPNAVISGGGLVCNNGVNTGTVNISISGGLPPYNFTYAINGVPQTPIANYSGPFPYVVTATSSGTYTLVSVSSGACNGTVSGSAVVTFVPLPTVGFVSPTTVCIDTPPFGLTGGTPVGGIYSGPGVTAGSFNPSVAGLGNHTLIYSFTDANNCTDTAHANIFVASKPLITNNPIFESICSEGSINLVLTSNTTGTTFSWTASLQSGSVTGFSNGNGANINQTLVNNGNVNGVVKYTIHFYTPICSGNDTDYLVTVLPKPIITNNSLLSVICSGSLTNIILQSNVAGTNFTWVANGSSGNVSGYSNGSGTSIRQILVNTSTNVESVSYIVTPIAAGCAGTTSAFVVTVNPAPFVNNARCIDSITTSDAKPFKLKGGTPVGGSYTGSGVTNGIFYPAIAGTGSKTITYTYTNVFGCNKSASKTILVKSPISFTCGNTMTDPRDGKVYPTVQIILQCWMAVNLNYGVMISSSFHQRDNCVNEKYCFQDLNANCTVRGANYQWDELMSYDDTPGLQGLCPPGWHVPTEAEWNTLFLNFTNNGFAGSPLKYSGYSGFNALLNGVNHLNRQWDFDNFATFFWSSSYYGPNKAWAHGMNDYNPSVSFYPAARVNAFSVRCLKD